MTAPDTAELMKVIENLRSIARFFRDHNPDAPMAVHADEAVSLLSTPTDAEVGEIESRVRPTICPTFGPRYRGGPPEERIEGRISRDDFNALLRKLGERAATSDLSSDTSPRSPTES